MNTLLRALCILLLSLSLCTQTSLAQSDGGGDGSGGGGICNPDIEICAPPCPPEDPLCNEPPLDELTLLAQLADSCLPGDVSRSDMRGYRIILITNVIQRAITPRGARDIHRKLMGCM